MRMKREVNCEECGRLVKGRLYRGKCRACYDRARTITTVAIPARLGPLFSEYMGERDDVSNGIIELVETGLNLWKHGKTMRYMEL